MLNSIVERMQKKEMPKLEIAFVDVKLEAENTEKEKKYLKVKLFITKRSFEFQFAFDCFLNGLNVENTFPTSCFSRTFQVFHFPTHPYDSAKSESRVQASADAS